MTAPISRCAALAATVAVFGSAWVAPVSAQADPNTPLRMIVGFAPGGAAGIGSADFAAFFRKQYDGFVATVCENNVKFE